MRRTLVTAVSVTMLLIVWACTTLTLHDASGWPNETATASTDDKKFQLRVALYPWVPEETSFMRWTESEFERLHPDIDLVVRDVNKAHDWDPGYIADLSYEWEKTAKALTSVESADFQHLVEIDTMILSELLKRNAMQPFSVQGRDFLPFASQSVSVGRVTYGVPHWTCGYFIISGLKGIRTAKTLNELLRVLAVGGTDHVDIAGDMDGSWDSVMIYLDAFRDHYPAASLQDVTLHSKLDPRVAASLQRLRSPCTKQTVNHCGQDGAELFAKGGSDALFGYSERLFAVAKAGRDVRNLTVASAVLGPADRPVLFTDALVLSPQCDSVRCRDAARAFAEFYTSDQTFATVLMTRDKSGVPPRYLLPATSTAFEQSGVADDPIYRQLRREIRGAKPYPNEGVPEAKTRGTIRALLKNALGLQK